MVKHDGSKAGTDPVYQNYLVLCFVGSVYSVYRSVDGAQREIKVS